MFIEDFFCIFTCIRFVWSLVLGIIWENWKNKVSVPKYCSLRSKIKVRTAYKVQAHMKMQKQKTTDTISILKNLTFFEFHGRHQLKLDGALFSELRHILLVTQRVAVRVNA